MTRSSGSFRDPEGHVFTTSGRIFRGISDQAVSRFRSFIRSDFYSERAGTQIAETKEVTTEEVRTTGIDVSDIEAYGMWVEHQRIPFISYPYEWPFDSLKKAACLTLDLLVEALKSGYTLKDASAFNVQFIHGKPIFIDVLSFTNYEEGKPFVGYKQFCEHFLAPLCLTAFSGIDYNTWFRGRMDGLDLVEVSQALPASTCLRPQALMHIHLQAWAMRKLESRSIHGKRSNERFVKKQNLIALFANLRRFIGKLERKRTTYWQNYSECNSYNDASLSDKANIARNFVIEHSIRTLLDLGCNTGEYSKLAAQAGARRIVGTDIDYGAINRAVQDSEINAPPIQYIHYDVANPSPNLGWMHQERCTLEKRLGQQDGVFCFALLHHLVIGRNLPLEEVMRWVCERAERGLIEFVPKSDDMVQGLLHNREDIFPDYNREKFEQILNGICTRTIIHPMQSTERLIYEYEQ